MAWRALEEMAWGLVYTSANVLSFEQALDRVLDAPRGKELWDLYLAAKREQAG